jgi:hypothetical protein
VDTSRERDQSIERLLRQSLQMPRDAGVTDSCLDAEALAAWVDGGLSGAALEMAQSHVADCARCQSLVGALSRTNAAVAQPEPGRAARRWLPWLVPLTAAAAAVALWVAVPGDLSTPQGPAEEVRTRPAETSELKPELRDNQAQAPTAKTDTPAAPAADKKVESPVDAPELRKETGRLQADDLQRQDAASAPAAAPPSAPPAAEAPVAARPANSLAETIGIEIVSPDPSVRWRIAGSVVERSTNGGANWDAVPTGVAAVLTAGAAPTITVCWVVGRGGVVLLSTDGRTWRRVAFPEMTDLSAVRAVDARTASVSTADGRIFSTSDGGLTWDRRQ